MNRRCSYYAITSALYSTLAWAAMGNQFSELVACRPSILYPTGRSQRKYDKNRSVVLARLRWAPVVEAGNHVVGGIPMITELLCDEGYAVRSVGVSVSAAKSPSDPFPTQNPTQPLRRLLSRSTSRLGVSLPAT